MKFLVTGAAGFIGFHTCKALLDRGDEVIGLDNLNGYYDVRLKQARLKQLEGRNGFSFHKLDLVDRKGIEELFATTRPQRVIHLAAQAGVRYSLENPHAYIDSNIVGHAERARRLPPQRRRASRVCLIELGLWRQHRACRSACTRTSITR